jgi:hypothetical protein
MDECTAAVQTALSLSFSVAYSLLEHHLHMLLNTVVENCSMMSAMGITLGAATTGGVSRLKCGMLPNRP